MNNEASLPSYKARIIVIIGKIKRILIITYVRDF